MTVYLKELRLSLKSFLIWTIAIAAMMLICIILFPEVKGKMGDIDSIFANLGDFTAAFGLDKLSMGTLMGFYGIECGNVLGIGGGFFAAFAGISILANEEKEHTAEYLLTHPISRASIITQKLLALITQIIIMNVIVVCTSLVSILIIGEQPAFMEFFLLHLAFLIMQLEIACICFGISAFIKRGNLGIGLGLALLLYFLNIMANIGNQASFLKYLTPYAYAEASNIIPSGSLDYPLIIIGVIVMGVSVTLAYLKYTKKDIGA